KKRGRARHGRQYDAVCPQHGRLPGPRSCAARSGVTRLWLPPAPPRAGWGSASRVGSVNSSRRLGCSPRVLVARSPSTAAARRSAAPTTSARWKPAVGVGAYQKRPVSRRRPAARVEFELQRQEIRNLGNGVIFGVEGTSGRLIGSTGRLEFRYATVAVWEERFIVRTTLYSDIDEARAAAGRLAEERAQADA